jgi:hypothetical protein
MFQVVCFLQLLHQAPYEVRFTRVCFLSRSKGSKFGAFKSFPQHVNFIQWGVSPSPNPQAGESPLVDCLQLLSQQIHGGTKRGFCRTWGRCHRLLPPSEIGRRRHLRNISSLRFLIGGMPVSFVLWNAWCRWRFEVKISFRRTNTLWRN